MGVSEPEHSEGQQAWPFAGAQARTRCTIDTTVRDSAVAAFARMRGAAKNPHSCECGYGPCCRITHGHLLVAIHPARIAESAIEAELGAVEIADGGVEIEVGL